MDFKALRTQTTAGVTPLIPRNMQELSLVKRESLQSAITILFAAALSHLIFAPWLGYYWDEWLYIWDGVTQTHANLIYQLSWDRPAFALWHGFVYNFLTDHTLAWHVYFFALVVGSAWLLVWALRGLWPERRFATTAIGLLYAVYPGFMGYPFGHLFHTHYFALAMGILSVGATLRALQSHSQRRDVIYTVIAVLSGAICLFIYEIYISFEVLCLLLIVYVVWRVQGKTGRRLVISVGRRWLPYLGMTAVFVLWRVFIFQSLRQSTDVGFIASLYQQDLLGQLSRVPGELARDVLETTLFAWFVPMHNTTLIALPTTTLVSVVVGAVGAIGVLLYGRKTYVALEDSLQPAKRMWAGDVTVIGFVTAIIALAPVVLAHMNLLLLDVSDRFTLTAVVPTAIFVVGLVFLVATPKARPWVISALVGMSVMTHFNNANYFRNVWNDEMTLWWQLYWRAPALKPETVLVVNVPQDSFFPSNTYEVWAPASLIYTPQSQVEPGIYGVRLTETVADQIVRGVDYDYSVQSSIHFTMDYDHALMLDSPTPTSCLRVVDGGRVQELRHNSPATLSQVAAYSHIEQVVTDSPPPTLDPAIFGTEPPHTWCYYFQKAELARQQGDWAQVAALGDTAREQGYRPQDASEWLVFIEGYGAVGRCEEARQLTANVVKVTPGIEGEVLSPTCESS